MTKLPVSVLAVGLAAMLGLASPASATVYIGLQEAGTNGGALTQVASDADGSVTFTGAYGAIFTDNSISVTGQPAAILPTLLASTDLTTAAVAPGQLIIYVTSTGNTQAGAVDFVSSLTSNVLPDDWTVALETFFDPGDGIFATTTPIGGNVFTNIGTDVDAGTVDVGAGPFSVTGRYTISAAGLGATSLSTIAVEGTQVPEPASIALLGAALLGLGVLRRRRKTA